jgi:hypothetical protein
MNTDGSSNTTLAFADEYDEKRRRQRREGETLQPGAPPEPVITQCQYRGLLAILLLLSLPVLAIMIYSPTSLDIHSRWGMLGYGALCVVGTCLCMIYHIILGEKADILLDNNKPRIYLMRTLATVAVIEVATCVSLAASMYG